MYDGYFLVLGVSENQKTVAFIRQHHGGFVYSYRFDRVPPAFDDLRC
jgi:hypothetical protein